MLIRLKHGHHPDRSGAIQLIFNPNTRSLSSTGVGHSDWNPYDAKIPLVWMGWGIKKGGRSVKQSHMIDIAPTLASILRITPDRKSTRLNSSHVAISYAVFCLKETI